MRQQAVLWRLTPDSGSVGIVIAAAGMVAGPLHQPWPSLEPGEADGVTAVMLPQLFLDHCLLGSLGHNAHMTTFGGDLVLYQLLA